MSYQNSVVHRIVKGGWLQAGGWQKESSREYLLLTSSRRNFFRFKWW